MNYARDIFSTSRTLETTHDRADLGLLASTASLVDRLFVVPYADPPERSFQWLHEQTNGDWVFRIDDDEAPSPALLELLAAPPADVTHAFVPRRWLWQDGWLDQYPWRPDWQLRLARRDAVSFPGLMHVPVRGKGPAPVNRRYSPRCPSDVPREGCADTCVINESHLSVGLPSAVFPAKAVICHAKRHGVGNDTEMGMEGKSSIPLNRPRINFRL